MSANNDNSMQDIAEGDPVPVQQVLLMDTIPNAGTPAEIAGRIGFFNRIRIAAAQLQVTVLDSADPQNAGRVSNVDYLQLLSRLGGAGFLANQEEPEPEQDPELPNRSSPRV